MKNEIKYAHSEEWKRAGVNFLVAIHRHEVDCYCGKGDAVMLLNFIGELS